MLFVILSRKYKHRYIINKKKAAKMKSTTANKLPDGSNKSNKGNANPGKKAAPSGKQQRGKKGGKGKHQKPQYPPGHVEWAAARAPVQAMPNCAPPASHYQQKVPRVPQPGVAQQVHVPQFFQQGQQHPPPVHHLSSQFPVLTPQCAPQFAHPNPYEVLGVMN